MHTFLSFCRTYKWIFLFGITILLFFGNLVSHVQVFEYYFSGFFQGIRWIWDHTLGYSPVPWIYVLAGGLVYYIFRELINLYRYSFEMKYSFFWKRAASKMVSGVCLIIFLFFILWGFNYKRAGLFDELGVKVSTPDSLALIQEAELTINILNGLRVQLLPDSTALDTVPDFAALENEIRKQQIHLLNMYKVPSNGRVRVRKIHPEGSLLVWSAAGIYIPFVMEGHIDGGLHPLQWPFVAAHEMAHGYGYTDEGDCNFIGFITCMMSEDLFIRYSAWLGYFRYLYYDIRALDKKLALDYFHTLHKGVRADLAAISAQSNKFPDWLPWWRDLVYHNYLKVQGVKEGLKSYNLIVRQVMSWKKEGKSPEISQ